MDANSWSDRLSSASRRYQLSFPSRSDIFLGFEEIDGDDDFREEFACPFCSDRFDIVSLRCHIDEEHPMEAKNGVCPVCAVRVGVDIVAHITLRHASVFKMQRKRKSRRGSHSMLSLLKRELREGNLQSLFGGSCIVSPSNTAPDPLLSSFISPMADEFPAAESRLSAETSSAKKTLDETSTQWIVQASPPLSAEDHKEKLKRSELVQGLLMSAILDDGL